MAINPCAELEKNFEQAVKRFGGDEMWEQFNQADTARKIAITDAVLDGVEMSARQSKLRSLAWNRLKNYFDKVEGVDKTKAFNDLISGGGIRQRGVVSLERRIEAVLSDAHSELYEMMERYRVRKFGFAHSKNAQRNMIREIWKKGSTGDKDAARFAEMWKSVTEKLRVRFNRAGGGVQRLFDWNLPQYHDAVRINRVSFDEWFNFTKDRIDRRRVAAYMVGDEGDIIGAELSDDQFKALMKGVYDNLRSEGIIHINAQGLNPHARRAVGNRHQQHRILSFKDADAWMEYADKFGASDYYNSMMGHLELMAREIGAMETLGPNPDLMMKQLRLMIQQTTGRRHHGELAENSYNILMGRMYSNYTMASDAFRGLRNTVTGLKIGSATISALSDLAFLGKTARFNNIPIVKTYMRFLKNLSTGSRSDRMLAARLGLLAEYAIDNAKSAHRLAEVTGVGASARFADAVVRLSGLNYWTNTAKQSFGLEFLSNLADLSKTSFDSLPRKLRRAFERYGITPEDWVAIQSSKKHIQGGAVFVNPQNFSDDELVAKVVGMVREETNFAVPEPNAKTRAILTGGIPSGTIAGEMIRAAGQFKSFAVSVLVSHFMRGLNMSGPSRLGYLASLLGGTTILGAIAIQSKQLVAGKTPIELSPEFWMSAVLQGGGTGILGDFLFMDHTRFGSLSEFFMGPMANDVESVARIFLGTGQQMMQGKEKIGEKFGSAAAKMVERATPKLWYTRLATQRYFNDWVNQMLDPNWHSKQRSMRKRLKKERGQEFWWKPGQLSP